MKNVMDNTLYQIGNRVLVNIDSKASTEAKNKPWTNLRKETWDDAWDDLWHDIRHVIDTVMFADSIEYVCHEIESEIKNDIKED